MFCFFVQPIMQNFVIHDNRQAFYDTCMRKIAPAFIAPFLKECQLKGSDSLLKMEENGITWEIK